MSISGTYIQLRNQIADELGDRRDLLAALADSGLSIAAQSPVALAIQAAIAKWEREPFYFNEVNSVDLFSTVAGQELYTTSGDTANLLANSPDILRLHIKISGNRYPMDRRSWQYIEDISINPAVTGQPFDWAYLAETLRLYPIPDGVYPITISGTKRLAALVNDSDANAWTQDAYDLIRSEAKLILARETLHDDELSRRTTIAIYGDPALPRDRGYLYALKAETTRRGRSRIRSTQF